MSTTGTPTTIDALAAFAGRCWWGYAHHHV
jgi:hypothetical protein